MEMVEIGLAEVDAPASEGPEDGPINSEWT